MQIGDRCKVLGDYGPLGLENTNGWDGLEGVIVPSEPSIVGEWIYRVEHIFSDVKIFDGIAPGGDDLHIPLYWDASRLQFVDG